MSLRGTFDEAPELYDQARPSYPQAVFDDLDDLASLRAGSRVLELGCGTGQATVPLARRGYEVVALELGANLAGFAREKLAEFHNVRVVQAAFEEWPLPAEPFDAVVAATSFHWLDPDLRLAKAEAALKPNAPLAVISTHHVAGGDARFFADVQRCYARWMPGTPSGFRLATADAVPGNRAELERSAHFGAVVVRRYEWEESYSTSEYQALLLTYSNHRALASGAQHELLGCVAKLIDESYGGRITKRYMTELAAARALPA